jgi:predicted DNA-binding protein
MSKDITAEWYVDNYFSPKGDDKKKSRNATVTVRLSPADLQLLDIMCEKFGTKRAKMMREFIEADAYEMYAALDIADRQNVQGHVDSILMNEYEYEVSLVRDIDSELKQLCMLKGMK